MMQSNRRLKAGKATRWDSLLCIDAGCVFCFIALVLCCLCALVSLFLNAGENRKYW